jgi:hypothetical protein
MDGTYIDKFWEKAICVEGCWGWKDRPYKNGYPYLQVGRKGKKEKASRVSFYIHNGYLPNIVRHTCDNPICTNPEHLIGGNQWDNVNDRRIRGRAKNQNTNKEVCKRGHVLDTENTYHYTNKGKPARSCRKCSALRAKNRRVMQNEDEQA